MADGTRIEWADATWSPVTGCTPVSPGCANCYAKRQAERCRAMGARRYRDGFAVRWHWDMIEWAQPEHWRRPRRIFVCSMSDLFHENVPFDFIGWVFAIMQRTPQHTFLVLTKRPQRMVEFLNSDEIIRKRMSSSNIWVGVTAEDQQRAEERVPVLLDIPAAVRFVSCEPLLGPVDLRIAAFNGADSFEAMEGIHHVICGGESGPKARPMDPAWARGLRDQCVVAKVPFLFKQWGEWMPLAQWGGWEGTPDAGSSVSTMVRVGKRAAGRLLDGQLWDQYPEGPR